MKRKVALLVMRSLTVCSLAGCGSSTADSSESASSSAEASSESSSEATSASGDHSGESIVVQVWGGTYEDTMREYAIPKFEEETGATVEVVTGAAPLSQLATEGEEASVDVVNLDETEVLNGNDMGIWETLDYDQLTNSGDLYDEAFKYDEAVITNWGVYGLCYRTDLVEEAPTSWNDMWDDEFKDGKLGFYDYTMGGGFETLDMLCKMDGTTLADESNWDNLFTKMAELKPSIGLFTTANEDVCTMLQNGDLKMATLTNGQSLQLKQQGVAVDYVMPEEGSPAMTSYATVTKGSTNKELAYKFLDILLSPEVQQAYAENNYYAPSNSTTTINDDIKEFMPYGEEQISSLVYMDSVALEPVKNDLIERWEQELK